MQDIQIEQWYSIYRIIPQIFLSPDKTSFDQFIGVTSFNASSEETIFDFLPDNLEKSNRLFFLLNHIHICPSCKNDLILLYIQEKIYPN